MFRQDGTTDLPEELILQFFAYLTPRDLAIASLVCHSFERFANFPELWKQQLKRFDHVYTWAASQENIDYKLLTQKVVQYPTLYAGILPSYISMVDTWNVRQLDAAEKLYQYTQKIGLNYLRQNCFFAAFALNAAFCKDMNEAVQTLKDIIFGCKTIEDFNKFRYLLDGSSLTGIYNELIRVDLMADTLSEMLESLQTPIRRTI